MENIVEVSAGVIVDDGGRVLICRRAAGQSNGLLWEFPGGKREAGEDAASCLVRECREELGITVSVESLLGEVVHEYPGRAVRVTFLRCHIVSGEPELREHAAALFALPDELVDYPFSAADAAFLPRVSAAAAREASLPAGTVVTHFKRALLTTDELRAEPERYRYEIVGAAIDTVTEKRVMVYRPLYGAGGLFTRPMSEFLSPVPAGRGAQQAYRFE